MMENNATSTKELDRVLKRSHDVLGEATVAGLSGRFASEATSLGERLKWSQRLLFAGVVLLFLSAGIALDIFPWLNSVGFLSPHHLDAPTSSDVWPNIVYLFGSLVGKLVLLLPSLVIITFAAKWYAALFRLRGEYAYKYSVAASLPGFKIEAPDFAEAITAAAFKELLYNPELDPAVERKDSKETAIGNSWLQKLLEPALAKAAERLLAKSKPPV